MRRLLTEDLESVCTQRHESLKHAREQQLNLHVLLDLDGHAHRVDRRLNQAHLLITLDDLDGLTEKRGIVLELNFRMYLALDQLRWEVAKIQHWLQVESDIAQVVLLSLCHLIFFY